MRQAVAVSTLVLLLCASGAGAQTVSQAEVSHISESAGAYSLGQVSATHQANARRLTLDFTGGAQARWYRADGSFRPGRQWGRFDLRRRLSRSTSLDFSAAAEYSPAYVASTPLSSAGGENAALPGIEIQQLRAVLGSVSGRLARRLGRRGAADAGFSVDRTTFLGRDGSVDRTRVFGGWARNIEDGGRVQVGLRFAATRTATRQTDLTRTVSTQEADVHVQWQVASHTAVSAGIAPALAADGDAPDAMVGLRAAIEHRLSERWRAAVLVQRALFVEELSGQAVLARTTTFRVDGRLKKGATVGVAAGEASSGLRTYAVMLALPLSRGVALAVEHQGSATSKSARAASQRRTRLALGVRW